MPLITDYPLQHTKAFMAISAITPTLEVLAPSAAPGSRFEQQIGKVMRWRAACSKMLDAKKISVPASRELNARNLRLFKYMQTTHLPPEARAQRWAEPLWVGVCLVMGVKNTCQYFKSWQPWVYLDMTAWTLGHILMNAVPGCDEAGTELYMEIYDD